MASPRLFRLLTRATAQYAALAVLAVATLVLCYLALTRDMDASDAGGEPASSTAAPQATASGTDGGSDGGTDGGAGTDPSASGVVLPNVIDQVDADFATGAALPSGGRIYDNEDVASGMTLTDGALVGGAPTGSRATSSLVSRTSSDVQKLAATVSFPGADPGAVVLVAWHDSLVDARTAGSPVPASGLRLEVGKTGWQLTEYQNGITTLQSGSYAPITGSAQVAVYRLGNRAYVIDPTGKVTRVRAGPIATLAGPWACWQLAETSVKQTPARIEAVSAG